MQAQWSAMTPLQAEDDKLRKNSTFAALILLAMMAVEILLDVAVQLGLLRWLQRLMTVYEWYMLINMGVYVVCLLVPTGLVVLFSGRRQNPFPSKRVSGGVMTALVLGGMVVAIVANVAADWVMSRLTMLGVPEPEMPDTILPTVSSLLLNIVATAILPALIEEMIFRGYILGAFREHGDGLAVVLSAVLFGLFHGNVLQVPFAFILGLALGFLVVLTDSIWPAVLLHFVNNLLSVVLGYLGKLYPDSKLAINNVSLLVFTAIGVIALAVLWRSPYLKPVGNGLSFMTVSERVGKLLLSPAMVCALVAMLVVLIISMVSGVV